MAGLLFWKNKYFEVGFEGVQRESFLFERQGQVIPRRLAAEDGKVAGLCLMCQPDIEDIKPHVITKAREPTTESLVQGVWRLSVIFYRYQKQSGQHGERVQ